MFSCAVVSLMTLLCLFSVASCRLAGPVGIIKLCDYLPYWSPLLREEASGYLPSMREVLVSEWGAMQDLGTAFDQAVATAINAMAAVEDSHAECPDPQHSAGKQTESSSRGDHITGLAESSHVLWKAS